MEQPRDNVEPAHRPEGAGAACPRREALRALGRSACLTGLAALGGYLAGRRLWAGGGDAEPCRIAVACGGCGRYASCGLPQALAARHEEERK